MVCCLQDIYHYPRYDNLSNKSRAPRDHEGLYLVPGWRCRARLEFREGRGLFEEIVRDEGHEL